MEQFIQVSFLTVLNMSVTARYESSALDIPSRISPISAEKCAPHIEGCEQTIKDITYEKAHALWRPLAGNI